MQFNVNSQAWDIANKTDENLIINVERTVVCCGRGIYDNNTDYSTPTDEDHKFSIDKKVFTDDKRYEQCYNPNGTLPASCHSCFSEVKPKMTKAFRGAGGLGLFFSFPEVNIQI